MWVPGQAHHLAQVHLGMDAGNAEHLPAPHAQDPDLTICSLVEEREVATRVLSCLTVYTKS